MILQNLSSVNLAICNYRIFFRQLFVRTTERNSSSVRSISCILLMFNIFYIFRWPSSRKCRVLCHLHETGPQGWGRVYSRLAGSLWRHYSDVIMSAVAPQITSFRIVYSPFLQAQIKRNIKAPRHWPCEGNSPVTGEFPAQRASNAENISIWWRPHV